MHTHWDISLPDIIWWHTATRQHESPTRAFPSPCVHIHWGKAGICDAVGAHSKPLCPQRCDVTAPFTSNTDSQWEDAERRKPGSEVNSGLCHRLVTKLRAINMHMIHKCAVKYIQKGPRAQCDDIYCTHKDSHTHTHMSTHTLGGSVGPWHLLRDMVLICGICIFRRDTAMPREAFLAANS